MFKLINRTRKHTRKYRLTRCFTSYQQAIQYGMNMKKYGCHFEIEKEGNVYGVYLTERRC